MPKRTTYTVTFQFFYGSTRTIDIASTTSPGAATVIAARQLTTIEAGCVSYVSVAETTPAAEPKEARILAGLRAELYNSFAAAVAKGDHGRACDRAMLLFYIDHGFDRFDAAGTTLWGKYETKLYAAANAENKRLAARA